MAAPEGRKKYLKTAQKDALVTLALNPIYCPFVIDNAGETPNFQETKKAKWRSLRENLIAEHPDLTSLDVKDLENRLRHEKEKAAKIRREDVTEYELTGNVPVTARNEPQYRLKLASYLGPIRGKISGAVASTITATKRNRIEDGSLNLKKLRIEDESSRNDSYQDEFSERSEKDAHNAFMLKYNKGNLQQDDSKDDNEIELLEMGEEPKTQVNIYYAVMEIQYFEEMALHFVKTARAPRSSPKTDSARTIELLEQILAETKRNGDLLAKILEKAE